MMTLPLSRVFLVLIFFALLGGCGEKGPRKYISSARLMLDAKGGVSSGELEAEAELICSGEMQQRVKERLGGALSPLDPSEVELKVEASVKTASIRMETVGTDPARVENYLKALVEEYLKFRAEMDRGGKDERGAIRVVENVSAAVAL